jgi:hypothetical protein
MKARELPAVLKRTSTLRRVPASGLTHYRRMAGREGDVGAFKVKHTAAPIIVEDVSGRAMALLPGDVFLGTPGHRESTRWVVGHVPDSGLAPGRVYWIIAESGVIGELAGNSPREKGHLAQVEYLGVACNGNGQAASIRQFAELPPAMTDDRGAPIYLVLGTSAEIGKTTAGITLLRTLRSEGQADVIALKATGTSSVTEIVRYVDHGARKAFDCVDFGLPTTYPSDRSDVAAVFDTAIAVCLSSHSNAIIVECGGDIFGANVPTFLDRLRARRAATKVILVAPDTSAALGAMQPLHEIGYSIDLITGPCTDTPVLQARTQRMCGVAAVNMSGLVDTVEPPRKLEKAMRAAAAARQRRK